MFDNEIGSISYDTRKYDNNITFYYGNVIEISTNGDKRIKVRIKGIDDKLEDKDLPWCVSFIPIHLCVTPKIGEMVKIIPQRLNDVYNNREWVGPVVVHDLNIDYQSSTTSLANQPNSPYTDKININKINNFKILYPQDGVNIKSRDNSDIILSDKTITLRSGKHIVSDKTKLNTINPAKIELYITDNGKESYTTVNSDKIILVSHDGTGDTIVTKEKLEEIINESLSATYAEPMITFMKYVQDFVANHIHVNNLPPNRAAGSVLDILNFDVESIKAKNIKIK